MVLSIPHGGIKRPPELDGRLCITERELFDDSDPFVAEIYDLGGGVSRVVKADIARTYVDLNRPRTDVPPNATDGVIKSSTCYRRPIYVKGMEPDAALTDALIRRYYDPYHEAIAEACAEDGPVLGLDCHSMAAVAPEVSPDCSKSERPAFCLSNGDGTTCTGRQLERMAECISESFGVPRQDIALNRPFRGGHITRSFGNNPVPWMQVEMNRSMYLDGRWFDYDSMVVDSGRLLALNGMFHESLRLFFRAD